MCLGGVLVDMRGDIFSVDLLLGNAFLINTQTREDCLCARVNLRSTVTDNTHYNLLPGFFAPRFAVGAITHVFDVLENADHGASEKHIIFVVHGNNNEEFGVSRLAKELLA